MIKHVWRVRLQNQIFSHCQWTALRYVTVQHYYDCRYVLALFLFAHTVLSQESKHTHFVFQPVEKTLSTPTLSMTHEGCLFQDLRVPPALLVSVDPYLCFSMWMCLWNCVSNTKIDTIILNAFTHKNTAAAHSCRRTQMTKYKTSLNVEFTHTQRLINTVATIKHE